MIRLAVAESLAEIDALRPSWEWLHRQQKETTIFQSFQWNRIAAQCFPSERPYVVLAESDSGIALIPAAVRRNCQVCVIGEELFDYRNVLLIGDSGVLSWGWSHLAGTKLPLAATPLRGEQALEHWDGFDVSAFCKAPCVAPNLGAETFAALHTRSSRQLRRLGHARVEVRSYSGENTGLLREIYSAKGRLVNGSAENLFSDTRRVDFMVAAARSVPSDCTIFTLEAKATLVAGLVTFRDRNLRRFYTTYFNPAWAQYSPGLALIFEATRLSLAEGLACDYMTGEQGYKLRLATGSVQLYHAQGRFCRDRLQQTRTPKSQGVNSFGTARLNGPLLSSH